MIGVVFVFVSYFVFYFLLLNTRKT